MVSGGELFRGSSVLEGMGEPHLEGIARSIFIIRGRRVMLDAHLAGLYGVPVKRLNEQVRRNLRRFPEDFMFHLSASEFGSLRSHFATLEKGRGKHRKYLPLVFTEQGVAMLSSVLNSERAIQANIWIMRAFLTLRGMLSADKDLAKRVDALEERYDAQFKSVFDAIRELTAPLKEAPRRIGFQP
ncbi:MAG: ORF6N domain-containing protein [Elusimicrobiota bacterium]